MSTTQFALPCLKAEGLQVFSTTADQRMMLGTDVFSQTHFPMQLRRYRNQQALDSLSEDEILHRLLLNSNEHIQGNQLFILYGAAGSGKSEMMAWLQFMLREHSTDKQRVVIRISRTELNVLQVVNKFKPFLDDASPREIIEARWEEMQRKPRTFTKLLVLRALENLLDSDDLINALYFRLIDIVEPHITRALGVDDFETITGPVDVLSRDDFEEVRAASVLPIELDFEQFRHSLLDGFREYMLDGLNLRETLTIISNRLAEERQRPLFIIDDLVQSINIFATEFLDYFITLDEGNWDAIIGLTPASFESDARGRELLERISYLDTIDDRIDKLWLSDQDGTRSYFLEESNCHKLAYIYLNAFRKQNGIQCQSCPVLDRCQKLTPEPYLSPFNREAIVRLFRGVPAGKGQVRYFIRSIKETLEQIIMGENPAIAMSRHGKAEVSVESQDELLTQIVTWYGPLDQSESEIDMSSDILGFFEFQEPPGPISIQSLTSLTTIGLEDLAHSQTSVSRLAIQDWLLSQSCNRQLLHGMRKGVAGWLRTIVPIEYLHRDHIARPWKVLRYRRVEMRISPAISLEDMDEFAGINVTRDIGHAGFWLENFGEKTGAEKRRIGHRLATDSRTAPLIWQGLAYRAQAFNVLQTQLTVELAYLALNSMVLVWMIEGAPSIRPPGIEDALWEQIMSFSYLSGHHELLNSDVQTTIAQLFDDCFRLRHNLYDGPAIAKQSRKLTPETVLENLISLPIDQLDENYRVGRISLKEFLGHIIDTAQIIQQLGEIIDNTVYPSLSSGTQQVVSQLHRGNLVYLDEFSNKALEEIRDKTPNVFRHIAAIFVSDRETED